MSTQNRYATLASDLMGKGAEPPPALPSRRRTPERLTGRAPVPSTAREAIAPAPVAPTAGDVLYDKGAATAANFRPSYWSYERNAANEPGTEPPAVVGMPLEPPATTATLRPAVADDLAATIEHVLGSRYASGRPIQDSAPKPRLVATAVTGDSLMAELAQARQSRSEQSEPKSSRRSSRGPKKAPSFLDRAFTFGGLALILFALLALSPWRDSFLSPSITHFFG
jgi:hypothetical protein